LSAHRQGNKYIEYEFLYELNSFDIESVSSGLHDGSVSRRAARILEQPSPLPTVEIVILFPEMAIAARHLAAR
jgi:hypothetical protein